MASLSVSLAMIDARVLPFNRDRVSVATPLTTHPSTEKSRTHPTDLDAVRLDLSAVRRVPKLERMEQKKAVFRV